MWECTQKQSQKNSFLNENLVRLENVLVPRAAIDFGQSIFKIPYKEGLLSFNFGQGNFIFACFKMGRHFRSERHFYEPKGSGLVF